MFHIKPTSGGEFDATWSPTETKPKRVRLSLATVNLSMHADRAVDYFQARSLDAQEQLLNSTVQHYEQALQLNQNRFQGGIAADVDVEQAKTQLQTTRAAAIDVGVLRAQYEHAVAILVGGNLPQSSVFRLCL
jgi:outer membrane protein TolC